MYLGIDGGGTKTKVIVINEKKEIIYEQESGPSSIDTVSEDVTRNNINDALEDFLKINKNCVFKSVFAGLGGIVDDNDRIQLESILKTIKGVNETTKITGRSDMENALASGLIKDGITLIVGTGMISFGKNGDKRARAGGIGYKEGDLGSGYSLGFLALRTLVRTLDQRYEPTAFTKELSEHLNISTVSKMVDLFDEWHNERTKVASLAPIVRKHADLGDIYAIDICDKMSYELALAVNAVYEQLKLKNPTLVIVGSLGNIDGYYKTAIHKNIHSFHKDIKIIAPLVDPAHAAALLAYDYYHDKQ